MAKYLIYSDSLGISKELYRLSRPNGVRPPSEDNHTFNSIIEHPTDGRFAMVFEDNSPLLIHSDSDPQILIDISEMNAGQANGFTNSINNAKITPPPVAPPSGNVLGRFPYQAVASRFGTIRNETFMENDGWFE